MRPNSHICALIPTYNNAGTIADVVTRVAQQMDHIIVVIDGSNDNTREILSSLHSPLSSLNSPQGAQLTILDYPQNAGKGRALQRGMRKAEEMGFTHVLTIDADGQHFPEDIPLLYRAHSIHPDAIIVGSRGLEQENMPARNTFANRFSNFWFALQTGLRLPDTQSGFRIYPLQTTRGRRLMTARYEAELLLLVLSAWANVHIQPVPVRVAYQPADKRVSHFRPAYDFTRISLLNTLLCLLALIYGLPRRWWRTVLYLPFFALYLLLFVHPAMWALRLYYGDTEQMHLRLHRFIQKAVRPLLVPIGPIGLISPISPISSSPAIYVANHTSHFDILVMMALHDRICFVTKDWVIHNPLFGLLAQGFDIIPASLGAEQLLKEAQNRVSRGYSIMIFPEGTRSLNGDVGRFRTGAAWLAEQLNLPIRPLLFRGFYELFNKTSLHIGHPKHIDITLLESVSPPKQGKPEGGSPLSLTRQLRALYRRRLDFFATLLLCLFCLLPVSHAKERPLITPYLADTTLISHLSTVNSHLSSVHSPAVIVCPGGSYSWLDIPTEGIAVAEWLQRNGINAYLLRYRVATVPAYIFGFRVLGIGHRWPDMLNDVEEALRYVYEHAEDDHTDTCRIGVMGFSAGGHLTMASWAYNRTPYKPKFLCPIYPVITMSHPTYSHRRSRRGALGVWGQWDPTMQDSLSIEKHITPDCPPVFLVNCEDDPIVDYRNSLLLDSALNANGVPHTYHRFRTGGHGFGAVDNKGTPESRQWKELFLAFISSLLK